MSPPAPPSLPGVAASFPLLCKKSRREVPDVFILVAPGVRSVILLQDYDCVPQMVVRKLNPEVSLIKIPTHEQRYLAMHA